MEALIPDKLFHKIGEVARFTSLKTSVLRYWETEFESLRPHKSRSGQRLYTKNDLELLFEIKRLLYVEKLTIAGAKKKLSRQSNKLFPESTQCSRIVNSVLQEIKEELVSIRNTL